jgi:hypothetical protein
MNKLIRMASLGTWCVLLAATTYGQKIDQERMERDIEVAENVLSTLLRQSTTRGRNTYYFSEVNGNYMPGYGVVFSVPFNEWYLEKARLEGIASGYSYSINDGVVVVDRHRSDAVTSTKENEKEKEKVRAKAQAYQDSARNAIKANYIDAMKLFLADYGDMLSQLGSDEKIMVTNRPTGFSSMFYNYRTKKTLLAAEVTKADLLQVRQGQMTRDQLIRKIKITNTESTDKVETDLELFSSILNRLYKSDLSKTYFASGQVYYEQLIDYGAVFYLQVYSSNRGDGDTHSMPTIDLNKITQEARDNKVIELYPAFEKDVKENLVEYGKTIRSLKPEELLVLNVKLTKCEKCGIPSTLELSVKASVLQDYASGKITKEAAVGKINLSKGPNQ